MAGKLMRAVSGLAVLAMSLLAVGCARADSPPPATSEGDASAMACPKTHQPLMNVPKGAAEGQLVPAAPTRALVCTYPPSSTARWPLGSSKPIDQAELDGLVAYLNKLPAWTQETGEADGCLAAGVAEHQIVLGYAGQAPATVSLSFTCAVAMNGPAARRLTSATELARFWES
jgi:hypothetical protein